MGIKHNLDDFKALIFDLDGTLIDSMPFHNQAWFRTMSELGLDIDETFLKETAGLSSEIIVSVINKKFSKNLDPREVSEKKRDCFLEVMHKVEVVQPVLDIIKKYHKKKPLGIITGGSHDVVDVLLPKLNIDFYFDSIICADDTKNGKDHPEPYELMGKHLSIDTKDCIFFDDGDVGLKGAMSAGMTVVHVDVNHPDVFIS
jgi:HAD superfamily hydrolase (TIGR01509 family)